MRALALSAVVCLVACGRSPSAPPGGVDPAEDAQSSTQAPVDVAGHYKFGPTVAQGFAGTPGRLADLRVAADGTFTMTFMLGCLMSSATGAWTAQGGDAALAVQQGAWTDDEGTHLAVTSLRATPRPPWLLVSGGLEVRFTTADDRQHTQFWDRVGP